MSQRQLFQRDVDRVASIKKSIYQANAGGVEGFIQMPSDIEIVQEALDFVVDKNKLVLSAEPVDRLVFANTKAEFQYNRLTAEDFASAASERPQQIPENTSYELSEEANELVGTPTQEGRKPSFENITTSETVSLAKALSKDKDFINEPIEVITSSYNSMLNKLPKDDVTNRTLIQNELDKILDMKQRGEVDTTKVTDMKQKGEVDETKVTTFGSILDKDFRKSFEKEREKQERVPLLKVLGLDRESVKNRIIKQAEDFVSGERTIFSAKQFNDWLEETKGIKFYKVKKEDKPELVREFLEFLKEA